MITRSLGISPGLPWGGPLPGGGYDGKTKRLDRAVQRFAEWLHRRIAGPVQVRFNSHRLSGGAFVYPGLDAAAEITFDTLCGRPHNIAFCGAFSYVASNTIPRRFLGSLLCWTPHNFRSTGFAGTP